MSENTVKTAVLQHEVEAKLLASILSEREIPHMIRSYHDAAYDGLFTVQKGWGVVYAPESYRELITQILDEIRSRQVDPDEGEEGKA
jgi:hypothetical protein